MSLKKIAIVGPESTGKSELAEKLASHFQTAWVPEYAREYLENLDRPYNEADLLEIAKGQLQLEDDKAAEANGFLFCDTNLVVLKIWSDHSYGKTHPWILEQLKERTYDFYLLTDIDLPWEEDPLREHPEMRGYFFEKYKEFLLEYNFPFGIVNGDGKDRLRAASGILTSSPV